MTIRQFISYLTYSQEITIWHKQTEAGTYKRYTTDIVGEAYLEDFILDSRIRSINTNMDAILVIHCIS